jgi:hypothetical protein
MKILYGEELASTLRTISDSVTKRLWIAVPYIGSLATISKVLGKAWFEMPSVSVRMLTDVSEVSNVNTETIQLFHSRGEVKSLMGLHAKIYLADDRCLITSANLTNTAFSKRHEVGILVTAKGIEGIVKYFNYLWEGSENIQLETLNKIYKTKRESTEEKKTSLPTIHKMPEDAGAFAKNLSKRFLNYERLIADYEDFSDKYMSIQRLWENAPIYLEIDGLLNYLYHHAPGVPSKKYKNKPSRRLSSQQQIKEIRKWAKKYRQWNAKEKKGDDIGWRLKNSRKLKRLLSPSKVQKLTKAEIEEALYCINSLSSYPINITKILNNNSKADIRKALYTLINGEGQLAERMNYANNIKNLGTASMNEFIGYTNPEKYPLINRNSNSGLRYFGYKIKINN